MTKTIRINGLKNLHEIYALFKKNKVKHWPVRFIQTPDVYAITLKEDDPMLSYLLLKYGSV